MDYITTHTSLSPIRCGFAPGFVNYKKWCTRLTAASDKAYQLLAHDRWFSPGTPASSTSKTGRHIEILLKVALNTIINQIKSINFLGFLCKSEDIQPLFQDICFNQLFRSHNYHNILIDVKKTSIFTPLLIYTKNDNCNYLFLKIFTKNDNRIYLPLY